MMTPSPAAPERVADTHPAFPVTRPGRRNQARAQARTSLRAVRKQQLAAFKLDPQARVIARQRVYASFFHQIFALSRTTK
jgi:hypothetical protein